MLKVVPKNFAKFTGKLWHMCFPVIFAEFLRTPFFIQRLWWLLLNVWNLGSRTTAVVVFSFVNISVKVGIRYGPTKLR